VFEVKLKRTDDETDKHQVEHPVERTEQLTEAAVSCLGDALSDVGLRAPADLAPTLHTSFSRITLAASESTERLTCDLEVHLSSPNGKATTPAHSLVLVETKTEQGEGSADQALAKMGVGEISLSKYRVGMSLVGNVSTDDPQPGSDLFSAS
jgi:hypothetical protein